MRRCGVPLIECRYLVFPLVATGGAEDLARRESYLPSAAGFLFLYGGCFNGMGTEKKYRRVFFLFFFFFDVLTGRSRYVPVSSSHRVRDCHHAAELMAR